MINLKTWGVVINFISAIYLFWLVYEYRNESSGYYTSFLVIAIILLTLAIRSGKQLFKKEA